MEKTMDKIVALAKARGFVYPGSEIYGGLANTWDYGNLGVDEEQREASMVARSSYRKTHTTLVLYWSSVQISSSKILHRRITSSWTDP